MLEERLCKDPWSFTLDPGEGKVTLHRGLWATLQLLTNVHALVVQVEAVDLLGQVVVDAVQVVVQTVKGMPEILDIKCDISVV